MMKYGCRLFNDGWEFIRLPLSAGFEELEERQGDFAAVGIPHDWLIGQADKLYEDGAGWYRRYLDWEEEPDRNVVLRFEGIYMDSAVYVNRALAVEWKYGYSTFEADITPWLRAGRNEILVRAAFQSPNSRWYSGAGIYRDVWLKVRHRAARLVSDGSRVTIRETASQEWELCVETEVETEAGLLRDTKMNPAVVMEPDTVKPAVSCPDGLHVKYQLVNLQTGEKQSLGEGKLLRAERPAGESAERTGEECADCRKQDGAETLCFFRLQTSLRSPSLWDVESPSRYRLCVVLTRAGEEWQREKYTIGFRVTEFSPEKGFLLNHRKVKLNGVCEHHDLGCLGAAYCPAAMRRKLQILRRMGVNALRLTHNMPAPDVMELADEMGFLVVSEAFDMWESPKNAFDYARFFPEWYEKDVASWVRRDRNHPSLIMWSIGNEIYDTHVSERGQELTRLLLAQVRRHDPDRHGEVTIGSNYMPWENAWKCADIVKLAGYNYAEKYYDAHHREHPDWIIYGSETGSTVQSRGVYHFPFSQSVLADVDEQCSALGNSTTSWGAKSSESCIIAERDRDFSCGQFLWSGFDYIGEPTPYHTRNSYFGQVDTAGFPKDSYYIYQAEWTDYRKNPMVHVFPYWDFNEGQLIDVRVCSNAPRVELFLNGESRGGFTIDHKAGAQLVAHWQIPYMPGELLACAYDESGREVARESRKSFGESHRIVLKADRTGLRGDGRDMGFVEISVLDEQGNPVENAADRIHVSVTGAGYLAGLDNGDSTDREEYKTDSRRLFNGKLLAAVAAGRKEGIITVEASAFGLVSAKTEFAVKAVPVREGTGRGCYAVVHPNRGTNPDKADEPDIPVRAIRISSLQGTRLDAAHPETVVTARLCPENALDREVVWCAVNEAGIPSTLAEVKADGLRAVVRSCGDGRFRLRCMSKAGTKGIRVISELDFEAEGLGRKWLDPYGFIAGGLYDYSAGEVGNGNEHGVATGRDGETRVGFHGIDFGDFGSDLITLPIFALDDREYRIQIWEGMPGGESSSLVGDVVYQKPSRWNVYQEETYRLKKRLKGVTDLCFVLHQKIHLKGFSFRRPEKAFERLQAAECSRVYGDSFVRTTEEIEHIGNNVTVCFDQMDFGEKGTGRLVICGYTPLEKNAIQLRFESPEGGRVELAEFVHSDGASEQSFDIPVVRGEQSVSFVFLPGSNFDFKWFRFVRRE